MFCSLMLRLMHEKTTVCAPLYPDCIVLQAAEAAGLNCALHLRRIGLCPEASPTDGKVIAAAITYCRGNKKVAVCCLFLWRR